jgi:hypothetical protein
MVGDQRSVSKPARSGSLALADCNACEVSLENSTVWKQ